MNALQFSDDALALLFAERHADRLRYYTKRKCWFVWAGKDWAEDQTRLVFSLARDLCREQAAAANDKRTAMALASARTVNAVVRLARCDQRLVTEWHPRPPVREVGG
jgi:putative DNA primase/helicase